MSQMALEAGEPSAFHQARYPPWVLCLENGLPVFRRSSFFAASAQDED
jgi:hypothetical protein